MSIGKLFLELQSLEAMVTDSGPFARLRGNQGAKSWSIVCQRAEEGQLHRYLEDLRNVHKMRMELEALGLSRAVQLLDATLMRKNARFPWEFMEGPSRICTVFALDFTLTMQVSAYMADWRSEKVAEVYTRSHLVHKDGVQMCRDEQFIRRTYGEELWDAYFAGLDEDYWERARSRVSWNEQVPGHHAYVAERIVSRFGAARLKVPTRVLPGQVNALVPPITSKWSGTVSGRMTGSCRSIPTSACLFAREGGAQQVVDAFDEGDRGRVTAWEFDLPQAVSVSRKGVLHVVLLPKGLHAEWRKFDTALASRNIENDRGAVILPPELLNVFAEHLGPHRFETSRAK